MHSHEFSIIAWGFDHIFANLLDKVSLIFLTKALWSECFDFDKPVYISKFVVCNIVISSKSIRYSFSEVNLCVVRLTKVPNESFKLLYFWRHPRVYMKIIFYKKQTGQELENVSLGWFWLYGLDLFGLQWQLLITLFSSESEELPKWWE